MIARLLRHLSATSRALAHAFQRRLHAAIKPAAAPLVVGTVADLWRNPPELIAENALLRHQLIILQRSVKRPRCTATDRALLVLFTSRLRTWRHALLIVQPETVLRWHRELFRCVCRRRSQPTAPAHRPPLAPEMVALIRQMAAANRLWGAERIRGELLKLNIHVAKWTIQKYMREVRPPHAGQTWATFLHNHAHAIWAADFLPVTDLLFRPLYAFFVIELASRRVVHVGVTRHPTDAWVAQQLREATPFGDHPKHLITDNDSTYGPLFAQVATATGIDHVRTAYRAPLMNAVCERFLGSARRECLDHVFALGERQLQRVLQDYVTYFNCARPHQGLQQRIPDGPARPTAVAGRICATPVLGGLHHSYYRAA
jgi:transposase InsO family protein